MILLVKIMLDMWNLARLMAEMLEDTMVLGLCRNLKYSLHTMHFSLEQNHLAEFAATFSMLYRYFAIQE